jgi:hypothetical protein
MPGAAARILGRESLRTELRGRIARAHGETYRQVASYGYTPQFNRHMEARPLAPGRGSIAGRVLAEGKVVQNADNR